MSRFYFCRAFAHGATFERRVRAASENAARAAFWAMVRAARLTHLVDFESIEIYQEA